MKAYITEGRTVHSESFCGLVKDTFKLIQQTDYSACPVGKIRKCGSRPVTSGISVPRMLSVVFTYLRKIFYKRLQEEFCFPQMNAPLTLDSPDRITCRRGIFKFKQASVHLIYRLFEIWDRCMQFALIGAQLLHKTLFCIDHIPGLLQDRCLLRV